MAFVVLASQSQAAPENLARRAKASANTEFSRDYLAAGATDGKIPAPIRVATWARRGRARAIDIARAARHSR